MLSAAVAFALASLVLAGLNDVVFKRYSSVGRSRGVYVMGIGMVWACLQGAIVLFEGGTLRIDGQTLAFGLAAGLVVAVANLILVESLTYVDVGLAATIYRLNTVAVVVMAILLLDEPMTAIKLAGVLLGVAAIVLLFERKHDARGGNAYVLFFALVVVASLLRACFGIVSKAAVTRGVDLQLLLLVNAPVWILVGWCYAMAREGGLRVTRSAVAYSLVSGVFICGIANFLMMALARGEASVVMPIANMSFVVAILLSAGLAMERLTGRKLAAVGLAIAAIVLLSRA